MRTLLIVSGNSLRGDDGVAHRVLHLLGPSIRADVRSVLQLTPELASEMAGFDTVVFLDAAVDSQVVIVEAVPAHSAPAALTHVSRPSEIVVLARALFGFKGLAFQCRIPVADLATGERLSPSAGGFAGDAARILLDLLGRPVR